MTQTENLILWISGKQKNKVPGNKPGEKEHDGGKDKHYSQNVPFCVLDPVYASGTVIVAQDRRGSLIHGINRRFHRLAHAGNDRHDRDVHIAAGHGQHIVAADRHEAVCELHDKSGRAEAEDIFRVSGTFRDLILMKEPQLQLGFFREEKHDEGGR